MFTDNNGNPITIAVNPVSAQLFNLFPVPNLLKRPFRQFHLFSRAALTAPINSWSRSISISGVRIRFLRATVGPGWIRFFLAAHEQGERAERHQLPLDQTGPNQLVAWYTSVISPRWLNEARFGFTRSNISLTTEEEASGYNVRV